MRAPDSNATHDGVRPFVGVNGHRVLLADRVRTHAFQQALEEVVKPGMSVLDIGTGTGILSFIAARAGAGRVVGVDLEPVTHLAAKIAEANGLSDVVSFIQADSRSLDFGAEFDVIVSECMGNFFVTDEMQLALKDARRMLKPGGCFIPNRIDLHVAPVFFPQFNEINFWREDKYGFDFGPVADTALHQCYVQVVPDSLLMGAPVQFASIDFMDMQQDLTRRMQLELNNSITIHGLCGWFDAQLSDSVLLSTHPREPVTHWAHTLFPIEPTPLQKGDIIDVELSIDHAGDLVRRVAWVGDVKRGGEVVHSFDHDTNRRFANQL